MEDNVSWYNLNIKVWYKCIFWSVNLFLLILQLADIIEAFLAPLDPRILLPDLLLVRHNLLLCGLPPSLGASGRIKIEGWGGPPSWPWPSWRPPSPSSSVAGRSCWPRRTSWCQGDSLKQLTGCLVLSARGQVAQCSHGLHYFPSNHYWLHLASMWGHNDVIWADCLITTKWSISCLEKLVTIVVSPQQAFLVLFCLIFYCLSPVSINLCSRMWVRQSLSHLGGRHLDKELSRTILEAFKTVVFNASNIVTKEIKIARG